MPQPFPTAAPLSSCEQPVTPLVQAGAVVNGALIESSAEEVWRDGKNHPPAYSLPHAEEVGEPRSYKGQWSLAPAWHGAAPTKYFLGHS